MQYPPRIDLPHLCSTILIRTRRAFQAICCTSTAASRAVYTANYAILCKPLSLRKLLCMTLRVTVDNTHHRIATWNVCLAKPSQQLQSVETQHVCCPCPGLLMHAIQPAPCTHPTMAHILHGSPVTAFLQNKVKEATHCLRSNQYIYVTFDIACDHCFLVTSCY